MKKTERNDLINSISNRQLKKVTKAKSVFPTDDSLFKMLYPEMKDITKKWTGKHQDWSRITPSLLFITVTGFPNDTLTTE